MNKTTVIIGASINPERYSYKAAVSLNHHHHPIVLLGKRSGKVEGVEIMLNRPILTDVDTVTLYINPSHQKDWYTYIIETKPKRVIFNPGTENHEFEQLLLENNIEAIEACTLVLLATASY